MFLYSCLVKYVFYTHFIPHFSVNTHSRNRSHHVSRNKQSYIFVYPEEMLASKTEHFLKILYTTPSNLNNTNSNSKFTQHAVQTFILTAA